MTHTVISSGQTISGLVLAYGDYGTVGGTSLGTVVDLGGFETISSGGTAMATTVSGGSETISSGGTAVATMVSGGNEEVASGGVATATTLAGGFLSIDDGGAAVGLRVTGVSFTKVQQGGLLDGATLSGADLMLSSGASTAGTITFSSTLYSSLVIDGTTSLGATLAGLPGDNLVVLAGLPYAPGNALSVSGNTVTVTATNGATDVLTIAGASSDLFTLADAGGANQGQTELTASTLASVPGAGASTSGSVSTITLVGGSNTVTAGNNPTVVYASSESATVTGGAGSLTFIAGSGNDVVSGGAGPVLAFGGMGHDQFTGGTGGGSVLVAGAGNATLSGGQGNGALMFGGTGYTVFTGSGGGGDTMVGGSGTNTFELTNHDVAFGGTGIADGFSTSVSTGSALIVEGASTTQVNLRGGTITAFDGRGPDDYTLFQGGDTQVAIVGFKAADHLTLSGLTTASAAAVVAGATTGAFGTALSFSDGTHLTLFGATLTAGQISV